MAARCGAGVQRMVTTTLVCVVTILLLGAGSLPSSTVLADVVSADAGLEFPYGSDYTLPNTANFTRLAGGSRNNLINTAWNAGATSYKSTLIPHAYEDGLKTPSRSTGPNARVVSNKLFSRLPKSNTLLTNDLQTIWGQLTVLDVCNTLRGPNLLGAQYNALRGGRTYVPEEFGIHIPVDDVYLNPFANASLECKLERSAPYPPTMDAGQVREQMMDITGWIDAGWLYGSAGKNGAGPFSWAQIRENGGVSCRLNNTKWMSPTTFNLFFTPEAGAATTWKMRGDLRTNKTPDLISLTEARPPPSSIPHAAVFGLEHNRLCDEFAAANAEWDQERLFHEARKWIIAYLQKITTREWLAAEMGTPLNSTHYGLYGYDATVDPRIENFFCSVAFRYGHSQVNTHIPLLDDEYLESDLGNILVRDWYFATRKMTELNMVEPVLRGLTATRQGLVDTSFVDDLRNYMFAPTTWTQFQKDTGCPDLAATNIQRGRDHGMPDYNTARQAVGLSTVAAWSDMITDADILAIMTELYPGGPSTADPYVAGLLEEHVPGAHMGPLFRKVIMDQFERLRNGDRFWYERKGMFSAGELTLIYRTTLMDIISRNMNVTGWGSVSGDTFFLRQRYLANIGGDQFFPGLGDYDFFVDLSPAYRLSWTPNRAANEISFMIQCRNSGWVGVGFSPDNGTMKNADIVLCRRQEDNSFLFTDAYALDVGVPTWDTVLAGGSNSLTRTSGTYADGVVTCKFTRPISSSDPWDKNIEEGLMKVIFAFHPTSNDLIYHGPTRSAAARLNLLNTCLGSGCQQSTSSDTGAIVGGVVGGVGGLLLLLLLVLLAICFLLLAQRKKKEEHLRLAEQWSDEESDTELDDLSGTSESTILNSSAGSRSESIRKLSITDLESSNITFEPKMLMFGLGKNDKCPVDKEVSDEFVITNHGPTRKFTFFVPAENERFTCRLYPGNGVIKSGKSVTINVHVMLLMTTDIERKIKFDVEGLGSHIISIKLVGELSTKLDPDDIDMIQPPIGQGSFGTVFKANYRGQEVAAKLLNSQMDKRLIEEFHRHVALLVLVFLPLLEVDMMTRLRCPYVINFVGASFVPGKICLVTELCTSGSVADIIFSQRNFNYLLVLKVSLDMAKAISFLHTNRVLHRDIKPDNFLIVALSSKAPVSCKIADFGTSRSIQQAQEFFNHTAALGTPIYMAPEILDHKPYSAKVDVYSFAIVLWVLYTRREPYTEMKRAWDIPKAVLKGIRPQLPDHCPRPFADLIIQCWAQDAADRPEMSDVVSQLEKLFEEEKALKGDRDETGAVKKGVKPSDRAQTARQFEDEEEAEEAAVEDGRTGTWAGGRKGIAHGDDSPPEDDSSSSGSSDEDDRAKMQKKLATSAKGKEKKADKRNYTGGI